MAINAKVGVDIGGFVSGIQQGQSILKGLNAEMKATEAEFKATGNAEDALQKKTKTLNSQLQVQKGIADQAQQALKAMEAAGIKPTDAAYQRMYATMMNATAGMNEAQAALNGLGQSANQAATNADSLNNSVNSIGKKLSIDQVLSGINSITSGLENAAKKAISLGEAIWENVMNAAKWADDTSTQAMMFGIDVETYQRMQKLVTNGMDTTVESMLKAQKKLKKGMGEGGLADTLKELGIYASELKDTGGGILELVPKDSIQLFWEAGRALMNMNNEFDKEAAAQKLFGRSWEELVPLFKEFANQEEYNKALKNVKVNSEESVESLADLYDKVGELKGNLDTLSREMLAQLAPALTEAAEALNGLLTKVMDYLETPEGQEALKNLQEAVSGLFDGLGEIDPESLVQDFSNAFNGLLNGLKWIVENKDALVTALEVIAGGFAALKLGELGINIWKFIDGAKTLLNLGGEDKKPTVPTTPTSPTVPGTGDMSWWQKFGAMGLTGATMLAPAIIAGLVRNLVPDEFKLDNKAYVQAAEYSDQDVRNVREYAKVQNEINELIEKSVAGGSTPEIERRLEELSTMHDALSGVVNSDLWARYVKYLEASGSEKGGLFDLSILDEMLGGTEGIPVSVDPKPAEGSAQKIAQEIGEVTIPAKISITGFLGFSEYHGSGGGGINVLMKHANGLPFVPYDGYLAMLHRGERVLTASANRNYTFNSNNYFGNVNLNNGQDIDALCTSIDRHNRQVQSGFGA